jgi:hypothetical protein
MAIAGLAIWVAIWIIFMLIRFSSFDIRTVPGAGPILLFMLVASGILPLATSVLAVVSAIQKPKDMLSWITLVCSVAALLGQAALFAAQKWM